MKTKKLARSNSINVDVFNTNFVKLQKLGTLLSKFTSTENEGATNANAEQET